MKLPKISIVIPVYNVEEYIVECLQSVMRQTYAGPIECIIVDDCGKDNSIAITERLIAEYKGAISFHVLHHEHNRGLSAARNTGTEVASGDYVYYLDSDDYISDDSIESLVAPLKEQSFDMVVGDYLAFGGYWDTAALYSESGIVLGKNEIFETLCYKSIYVMAWNKLVSLSTLRKYNVHFIESILHEDEPWTFELSTLLESIYVVKKPTYFYRIRSNSIVGMCKSKEKAHQEYLSYQQIIESILKCAKQKQVSGEAFEELVHYLVNTMIYIGFDNNISIRDSYFKIRKLYDKPCGVSLLYRNKRIFKKRLHWYLPKHLAYLYLKQKYIRNNRR